MEKIMELNKFEESVGKMLKRRSTSECPSIDELIELAERGVKSPDYGLRIDHVSACGQCFPLYRELKKVESERKSDSIGWLDHVRGFNVKGSYAYESSTRLPAWIGGFLKALQQAPEPAPVYRSSAAPTSVRLLNPDPTNVSLFDETAVFSWNAGKNFVAYEVELEIEEPTGYRGIPGALEVKGTVARLRDGLKLDRSRRYRLVVRPRLAADDWNLPPDDAIFTFEVLSKRESLQAHWALENESTAPVSAAMVLYQLGCYAEAARIARRWPKDESSNEWASAILAAWERRKAELGLLD